MNSRRKWLRVVASVTALGLALAGAGLAWLVLTEAGLRRAVAVLGSRGVAGIQVEGASGRLAGPLRMESLSLQAGRVTVRAEAVEIDWDVLAILFGQLDLRRLEAASLQVVIGPGDATPADGPPQFMPRWLSLGLGEARVAALSLSLPNGTQLDYHELMASGRITHARIKLDEVAVDAGAWTARGSVGLVASDPLRLQGKLDWRLPGQALSGSLRAKGDLARLEASVEVQAPVTARAELALDDLTGSLRWEVLAESDHLDLAAWLDEPPVGPLAGRLQGHGTLQSATLQGQVGGPGLPEAGLMLEAQLRLEPDRLELAPLRLATPDGATSLVTDGRLHLGQEPRLELRSTWRGLAWPLAGTPTVTSPQGSLELAGWEQLAFTTEGVVAVAGQPEATVNAEGQANREGIAVTRSRLGSAAGNARATGYFGFDETRPWSVAADIDGLDLGRFRDGLDSRLDFAVAASGQGFGPGANWAAWLGPVAGRLHDHPASGSGLVVATGDRYEFRDLDFRVGPAHLRVDGGWGRDTSLLARLEVPDLAGLLPEAEGSIDARLQLSQAGAPRPGRSTLRADLSLRGRDLAFGGQRAAVLSVDADLDLSDHESSWLRLRGAGLVIGGQPLGPLRLSLDGFAREHDFDLQLGAGERSASLVGTGRYRGGRYELTADRIEATGPALSHYALESPLQLAVDPDQARLDRTCFVSPPQRACLEGEWSRPDGWSVSVSVSSYPLEALRPDLPQRPGFRGLLDLQLAASGRPGEAWTATGNGQLTDASIEYVTPSGRADSLDLGTSRLRLVSDAERHSLSLATEDSEALQLRAEGTLERLAGTELADSPLRGYLQLATSRLGLLPLLVPQVDRAAGSLRADLALAGTPAAPLVGGTVLLEGGELDLYQTNLELRDLAARIELVERGLTIEASGGAGDGSFRTEGALEWVDRELRGQLQLTGERLLVADVPEARVEASPDLTFKLDGRDISVHGGVMIPAARIEPRQLVGAVRSSADERLLGAETEADTSGGYRVSTDLRLSLGDDVRIDVFGLKGRLEGSVLVQTRPGEVATASGELAIRDGKYIAYSKELDVERGRLLFAGGPVSDPGVDLRASKKVPGYEVGVAVRGRLRQPELSLFSDPAMPQSQIASLLLVGRRLDNLDPSDRSSLGGSSSNLANEGGALLANQIGRYIGIDEVSLENVDGDESTLVIGKFLSPRLYISYGISLTEAINTFKLRYTIGDRWVISVESGKETSADVEYTIERGGSAATQPAP